MTFPAGTFTARPADASTEPATTETSEAAATSEVVDAVSQLDDELSFTAISDELAGSFVDENDDGRGLYRMLTVVTPHGSQPMLEPSEISQGSASVIIKYQVDMSGHSSCVANVIRADGYRVETIPGYCGENPPSQGLLDFMNS